MTFRRSQGINVFRVMQACACAVVIVAVAGCGGGSGSMSSNLTAPASTSGSSSGGSSAGSGTSSGTSNGSGSGSAGTSTPAPAPTPTPSTTPAGFLYVGLDDGSSYYGAPKQNSGHPSVAGFAISNDGSLTATPGSPYAGSSGSLAIAPGAATLYATSYSLGATLNTERIHSDGSLTTVNTLNAQPLSNSAGIYSDLSIDTASNILYATAIHGAGTNFLEIYKIGNDGSLNANGSQSATVNPGHLSFTATGTRAYEPFCYHLDGEILGHNVGSDGKLADFQTNALIPSLDSQYPACPHALAISSDGKYLATVLNSVTTSAAALGIYAVNSDGTLTAQSGSPYSRSAKASDVAWDPAGNYLAVAAQDGLWIYSFTPGSAPTLVGAAPAVASPIDHVAFSKNGNLLFATSAGTGNVYVFAFANGVTTPAPASPHKMDLAPYELAVAE
jgi:6-phosphogluconolactonase (cycloisomerase 2 family)